METPVAGNKITIPSDFTPREYQLPLLYALEGGKKRAVVVWHRRAGKDTTCLAYMFSQMFQRIGTYFYVFPTYNQAKKVIWDGKNKEGRPMLDMLPQIVRLAENNTEMKITAKNGSIFQLVGSENYDTLMGTNPVGCVFSEYSLQNPLAWEYFKPILLENNGWAIFCFTPRGQNHAYELFLRAQQSPSTWFSQLLTIKETHVFSEEDMEEERQGGMSEDMIQQEYYCNFASAIPGAYYARQMAAAEEEDRVTNVPWEPDLPVDTFWDLGISDCTAIWFVQQVGREVRLIDYYEASGAGLTHYIKKLKELPYVWGRHYAPHDIEVRELGSGRSRLETARSLGINFRVVPRLPVEDGIEAARNLIPRCWFDREKCNRGIQALRQYHARYDERLRIIQKLPVHDWSSHGADAFRYVAVGLRDKVREHQQTLALQRQQYRRRQLLRQRSAVTGL